MAKALKVGTTATCRTCGSEIVWKPPVEDMPWSVRWLHEDNEVTCKGTADEEWMTATRASPVEFCTQNKADYSGPCHAAVVDEETFMCAPHAKKEHEYRNRREADAENNGIEKTLREFLEPLCAHLNDFYDLGARIEEWDYHQARVNGRRTTGYIVVNPAKLVELLKEIEDVF